MRFTLKKSDISREICEIISKKCRKKDLDLHRPTKKNLIQLEAISKSIEKETFPKNFVCKKLKGNLGAGIFLHPNAKPILKGEVIAPYSGEVSLVPQYGEDDSCYAFEPVADLLLTKEEQKRYDPKNRYHPRRLYSVKLDAEKVGNFTRFINHSNRPNVVAYFVSTKEYPYQIVYFAKKQINPGEQLLVNYDEEEDSYWGALGIKPFKMTPKTFRLDKNLQVISGSSLDFS